MKVLVAQVGPEWVRTFDDDLTPGELDAALTWALEFPRPAVAPLDHLDYRVLALRTVDAYQQVLSPGPLLCAADVPRT